MTFSRQKSWLDKIHGWKFSEFWGWLSIESQPQNAEFKADFGSFSDKFLDDLNTINHFNLKFFIFVGILQVLKFEFLN